VPADLGSPKAPHQLAPPRRHDCSPSGAFVRVETATSRQLGSPAGMPWRRRQDRHRRPDAETPWSLAIAKADARASRPRADGSAGAPNPGTSMGGKLGDEGGQARPEGSRRTETERLQEQREGEAAPTRTAWWGCAPGRTPAEACLSGRVKEVSTGTN
jgi:hypothetical protein